jgi:hypothetical protein
MKSETPDVPATLTREEARAILAFNTWRAAHGLPEAPWSAVTRATQENWMAVVRALDASRPALTEERATAWRRLNAAIAALGNRPSADQRAELLNAFNALHDPIRAAARGDYGAAECPAPRTSMQEANNAIRERSSSEEGGGTEARAEPVDVQVRAAGPRERVSHPQASLPDVARVGEGERNRHPAEAGSAVGDYGASREGAEPSKNPGEFTLAEAVPRLRSTLEGMFGLIPDFAFDALHAAVRDVEYARPAALTETEALRWVARAGLGRRDTTYEQIAAALLASNRSAIPEEVRAGKVVTHGGTCPECSWRGDWDPANWRCGGCGRVQFGSDVMTTADKGDPLVDPRAPRCNCDHPRLHTWGVAGCAHEGQPLDPRHTHVKPICGLYGSASGEVFCTLDAGHPPPHCYQCKGPHCDRKTPPWPDGYYKTPIEREEDEHAQSVSERNEARG